MSFWKSILNSVISGAAQTANAATQQGADLKTVGVASGAGAIAGALQFILTHPIGQHPAVQAAPAVVIPPAVL